MNLETYIKKFEFLKNFEKKLPGISDGLEVLSLINEKKEKIFSVNHDNELNLNYVYYYNFTERKIQKCCIKNLNKELQSIYTNNIINKKIVLYNKLYWIFHGVLERNIKKNKYNYKNNYTLHQILSKFCHGLRTARTSDITKYFVHAILDIYYIQYLEISAEQFYLLMFDFILDLARENILSYGREDHSIAFNPMYKEDLMNIIFFSFEIILLGNNESLNTFDLSEDDIESNLNKMYHSYLSGNDEIKLLIKNMLPTLVISSSVEVISVVPGINNVFIDNVMYGIANKTKY